MQKIITLATNATANGALTEQLFDGDFEVADVWLSGTFGGAIVELQAVPNVLTDNAPSVNWVDISGAEAITAPQVKRLEIGKDTKLRAFLSNASGSTSITIIAKYRIDRQS